MWILPPEGWFRRLHSRRRFIIFVSVGYLAFGLGWIFFSDRLLFVFTDVSVLVRFSTVKGVVFVLFTALFLLIALSGVPDSDTDGDPEPGQSDSLLTRADRQPRWISYVLAAMASFAMLYLRMRLAVSMGERPLLILFTLPVILSSILGGLGPGLFATAIVSLGVDYYGLPPLRSFSVKSPEDLFQWYILIVNGVLTSCMSEMLIRARRQAERRRMLQEIAQEELRLSEERFQLAMRGANDGLWDWNLMTDHVYYSPRWKAMLGFGEEELDDHLDVWKQLVHPDDLQRTLSQVRDLRDGRSDRLWVEFRMRHQNGGYLNILSRGFPVTDDGGRVIRLVGTHTDVTEQRQAEWALKEREALLDKTSRIAKVGGWGVDVVTGEGSWTDEVARIHDLDPADKISVEIGLNFYCQEHRPTIERALREAIEEARPFDLELEIVSAKGIRKWIRTVGYPVLRDGRVLRLEGIFQDICERKKAEMEVLALNAELEQRVEQRTAELMAANQELDAFAYAVSHDLRAPLRAMSGFSQALIEDYGDRIEGEARIYLDQIIIGSRRMGELIEGLLVLSRSTRSRLQRSLIDLSRMAERLLQGMAAEDRERRVDWEVEPDLMTQGDETMMEAVLGNILGNAWKYTARRERAVIRFFSRTEGKEQFFCVGDNGAGFDPAHAGKIFQPFQRLHRQEEFPGIGIGLATAQRIIHRHGGRILAEGRVDQGATFCFSLLQAPGLESDLPVHKKQQKENHEK